MTRSANEVMNLAAKAARGAGAPPAQAIEFGRAVVCHLCAGRDPEVLRGALHALPQGPVLSLPLAFARVLETARDGVATGIIGTLNTEADLLISYTEALPFEHVASPGDSGMEVRIEVTRPAARRAPLRVTLPEDLADEMAVLAARTFVPESEASRLSGAGAGLSDND